MDLSEWLPLRLRVSPLVNRNGQTTLVPELQSHIDVQRAGTPRHAREVDADVSFCTEVSGALHPDIDVGEEGRQARPVEKTDAKVNKSQEACMLTPTNHVPRCD